MLALACSPPAKHVPAQKVLAISRQTHPLNLQFNPNEAGSNMLRHCSMFVNGFEPKKLAGELLWRRGAFLRTCS